MNINHHADDATLMSYAAGALPESFSLVLAAHLEQCGRCRERLHEAEDVGATLLDGMAATPVGDDSLERLWAAIDDLEPAPEPVPVPVPRVKGLPAVLAPYLPGGLQGVRWRTVAPGIRQYILRDVESGGGTARLLSIAPGTTIPHHGHGGSELTLILKGSFADEIGRFSAGDIADLDDSVQHQPVADTDEPCICLIATDERLRFTGVFSRLLQPLVGI
jgi:putative transcriptional regulator